VKELVAAGRLGRVTRFVSRFEMPQLDIVAGWRESPAPGLAGGVLFDLGAHLVDQAVQLFGEMAEVYAETAVTRVGACVDDDSFISLLSVGGVRVHLAASKANLRPQARFEVVGTEGAFTKWGLDPQQRQLAAGLSPSDLSYGRSDDVGLLTTRTGDETVRLCNGDYGAFYRGVVAALRHGAPPPVDPADAVYALRVLEAARASAAAHDVRRLSAVPS
jgi:predicted dehydrogenase